MMPDANYHEMLPGENLSPLVKCFWISANDTGNILFFTTLPDGCLELVIKYQDRVFKEAALYSIVPGAKDIAMPPGELKAGIRLRPLAQEYYIDCFSNPGRFSQLAAGLSGDLAADLRNFAETASADILQALSNQHIDRRKLLLFDLLRQTSGDIHVGALAQGCYWSERQINRYCHQKLGMPLKTYCNILKCHAAYDEIKAGRLYPGPEYCESQVLLAPDNDEIYRGIIAEARNLGNGQVAYYGSSFGAYWAARLAFDRAVDCAVAVGPR